MKHYIVYTPGGSVPVSACSRRHAVAEAVVGLIRDGRIRLLNWDAREVCQWRVEEVANVLA